MQGFHAQKRGRSIDEIACDRSDSDRSIALREDHGGAGDEGCSRRRAPHLLHSGLLEEDTPRAYIAGHDQIVKNPLAKPIPRSQRSSFASTPMPYDADHLESSSSTRGQAPNLPRPHPPVVLDPMFGTSSSASCLRTKAESVCQTMHERVLALACAQKAARVARLLRDWKQR